MNPKLPLATILFIIAFCGCTKDKVYTEYTVSMEQLQVTTNAPAGEVRFKDFMDEDDYVEDIDISGESRKENDDKAEAIYEEKIKNLKKINIRESLKLSAQEEFSATFVYTLKRDGEVLKETEATLTVEPQ